MPPNRASRQVSSQVPANPSLAVGRFSGGKQAMEAPKKGILLVLRTTNDQRRTAAFLIFCWKHLLQNGKLRTRA
jgi:hypothetical protein